MIKVAIIDLKKCHEKLIISQTLEGAAEFTLNWHLWPPLTKLAQFTK